MRYRLYVFDWDGTLMDSEQHIVASMQGAMTDLGLEVLDAHIIRRIIGLGMREALLALFPDEPGDQFAARFSAAYRSHFFAASRRQALFEGAEAMLRALHQHDRLLAVATGKSRRGLDRALNETGLTPLFHSTRCADETRSKPDPTMLREILAELQVAPEEALMIGDTEFDLAMAAAAGMNAVGVSYGVHEPEALRTHAPLVLLDSPADLHAWLLGSTQRRQTTSRTPA